MKEKEKDKIQDEIKALLKKKNDCELGYLVSQLDYSYDRILQNVMELKQKGEIFKLTGNKGYFSLEK